MRITLAQINPTVGDIDGNVAHILERYAEASRAGSDLVIFPEMCISGYPPQDLVERSKFIDDSQQALEKVIAATRASDAGVIVGLPLPSRREGVGKRVANAAVLVADGQLVHRQDKMLLPTYDVFDEARYFEPAADTEPVNFKGERLGISTCEDAWNDPELFHHSPYTTDPISMLCGKGATVIINISASPFTVEKEEFRLKLIRSHCMRHNVPFILVNQVGGNDQLVFDGRSLYVEGDGKLRAALPMFEEAVVTVDTEAPFDPVDYACQGELESIWNALVLGTRDYLEKCGFTKVLVGLSGGIDSAVTLALAERVVGADNVLALAMPSPYSSPSSVTDARVLCDNLGVVMQTVSIAHIMQVYDDALAQPFEGRDRDVTEENIQARIRGNILMAYSNKFGYLLLTTGNKSELAVGYCTLYGDMSGGLAVISDVPKMMVYGLAHYINRNGEVIPASIVDKVPSAELRPNQADQDTLPPYETLDAILDLYVEDGVSGYDIIRRGYDVKTVTWIVNAVRRNEYKRRQAALGLKVTSKAFGTGRRFPLAARYNV